MGAPLQKSYWCILFFTVFLMSQSVLATRKSLKQREPCNRFSLYYHDNRFSGDNVANATSIAVLNATAFGNYTYGMLVIFDDPMTKDNSFFSPPAARAQGFYFYDGKTQYNAWFAFTLVFNSSAYKGTLNVIGADLISQKTRDLSIVGGTGDFVMARGILTIYPDFVQDNYYFRFKMEVKLYECY